MINIAYIIPDGDKVDFILTSFTVPDGDKIDFNFEEEATKFLMDIKINGVFISKPIKTKINGVWTIPKNINII